MHSELRFHGLKTSGRETAGMPSEHGSRGGRTY